MAAKLRVRCKTGKCPNEIHVPQDDVGPNQFIPCELPLTPIRCEVCGEEHEYDSEDIIRYADKRPFSGER